MFGHDDDNDESITTVNPTLHTDDSVSSANPDPSVSEDTTASSDDTSVAPSDEPTVDPTPASDDSAVSGSTSTPVDNTPATDEAPTSDSSTDTTPSDTSSEPSASTPAAPEHDSDSLLDLKKTALEELAPLVDQLDQSAEEKFKTTMMMIQATDDSSLVATAHEAAKQITDEKVRAQALLDIVNEINYFTQDSAAN